MRELLKHRAVVVTAGLLFVLLDQWVKVQALTGLSLRSYRFGSQSLWLDVALSLNPGAFLSLGAGLPAGVKQAIFVVGVGVVVLWALYWALSRWPVAPGKALAVYAVALGGGSNLFDRVYRDGHVVDYLVLNAGTLHTGVFNLADIAITAGVLALLFEGAWRRAPQTAG